ncbi:MAG: hypothetical protein PHI90_02150, partial [Clostridia bacterium]|nr:hypothetical protein [Clostridia bacterium]
KLIDVQYVYGEGLMSMLDAINKQSFINNFNQGLSLLGHEITYRKDSEEIQGEVTAIRQTNDGYNLMVNEEEVQLSEIVSVR